MDLDALKAALKKRFEQKGSQTTSEFLLEQLKAANQELAPDFDPESPEFRTAVILMAAAYLLGPRVDLLVQFTGYPLTVVADIAHRMRTYGLWRDSEVRTEGWWEDDRLTGAFWADCLVAQGLMYVTRARRLSAVYRIRPVENAELGGTAASRGLAHRVPFSGSLTRATTKPQ